MPAATVRLRPLSPAQRRTLAAKMGQASLPVRLHRRYRVIAEIGRGRPIREAAERAGINIQSAYDWLHRFNESGFRSFEAASNPRGRIPIISGKQIRELVDVALSSPAERGLPYTTWNVRTLTEYCRSRGLIPDFTDEWVRRLLRREGLTAQRIRTWKTSEDPRFDPKGGRSAPSTTRARRARRSSASTSGARSN